MSRARIIAVLIGGITLMWLTLAVTLAMTAPAASPRIVLSVWPVAATAKNVAGWNILNDALANDDQNATVQAGKTLRLAEAALTREPVMASAASAIGAALGVRRQNAQANAAFKIAERLSRRDLQAQLWFIERLVEQGDVVGALHHYDIALRTRPSAGTMLLPVLAHASANAAVRRPLIAILRRKPSWRITYFETLLQTSPDAIALADQIAHVSLSPTDESESRILTDSLQYLVRTGHYRLASKILPQTERASGNALRNPGFEAAPILFPFDWWLATDADFGAYREPVKTSGGAYVLRISSNNRGGQVARQLVTLSKGNYSLEGIVGSDDDQDTALPFVTVTCADAHTELATSALTPGSTKPRKPLAFRFGFTVPARDCVAQWIAIQTPPSGDVSVWMDTMRLHPA